MAGEIKRRKKAARRLKLFRCPDCRKGACTIGDLNRHIAATGCNEGRKIREYVNGTNGLYKVTYAAEAAAA